jgi:transcriptional regulator with XRE-family HTH domain
MRNSRELCRGFRFSPMTPACCQARPPSGIPSRIRAARKARRLTWHALPELAGIENQATIRDIEQGKDVKLSDLERIARGNWHLPEKMDVLVFARSPKTALASRDLWREGVRSSVLKH